MREREGRDDSHSVVVVTERSKVNKWIKMRIDLEMDQKRKKYSTRINK